MIRQLKNKSFTLKAGDICEEVDAIRLAIGVHEKRLRISDVWKFRTRPKGSDFFVTSSGIQSDMKGTVHPDRAHFGFAAPLKGLPQAWVGPPPQSRHYQILEIPPLKTGDYKNVFRVSFPGFALTNTPQPLGTDKPVTFVEPPASNIEVSFALTVVDGDWRPFAIAEGSDASVGLLTNDVGRSALISVLVRPYADVDAAIKNINRNLGLIGAHDRPIPDTELSALLWMERSPDDPLRIIELNGIRSRS